MLPNYCLILLLRRYEKRYVCRVKSSGHVTLSVWGAVCGGVALCLTPTPPRMDNLGYRGILELQLVPHVEALFGPGEPVTVVHDRASIHTARPVQEWFRNHPNINLIPDWPACSPDLNIIENVWARMVRDWEPRRERNKEDLWDHIRECWDFIGRHPEFLLRLARSMPQRLQAVIDAEGEFTKY